MFRVRKLVRLANRTLRIGQFCKRTSGRMKKVSRKKSSTVSRALRSKKMRAENSPSVIFTRVI